MSTTTRRQLPDENSSAWLRSWTLVTASCPLTKHKEKEGSCHWKPQKENDHSVVEKKEKRRPYQQISKLRGSTCAEQAADDTILD